MHGALSPDVEFNYFYQCNLRQDLTETIKSSKLSFVDGTKLSSIIK